MSNAEQCKFNPFIPKVVNVIKFLTKLFKKVWVTVQ